MYRVCSSASVENRFFVLRPIKIYVNNCKHENSNVISSHPRLLRRIPHVPPRPVTSVIIHHVGEIIGPKHFRIMSIFSKYSTAVDETCSHQTPDTCVCSVQAGSDRASFFENDEHNFFFFSFFLHFSVCVCVRCACFFFSVGCSLCIGFGVVMFHIFHLCEFSVSTIHPASQPSSHPFIHSKNTPKKEEKDEEEEEERKKKTASLRKTKFEKFCVRAGD